MQAKNRVAHVDPKDFGGIFLTNERYAGSWGLTRLSHYRLVSR